MRCRTALETETVFKKTLTKHINRRQTFPESPLTEHQILNTQHLHGGLQDQCTRDNDFGPTITMDANSLRSSGVILIS